MKRRRKSTQTEGCLDLVERATHLLRLAPPTVLALYYLGAAPFVLGLLYFLADMSASPFAASHCVGAALGMGLLYIWMRVWQALFCRRLLGLLSRRKPDPLSVRQVARQIFLQAAYSSWGLVVVPLAAVVALPFGWVFAYFNNLCVVDVFSTTSKVAAAKARAMALPWPKQNHLVIGVLLLFGYLVFLNIASVLGWLPHLLKMLAGIDSAFTQSYHWMLSTTFLGVAAGLAYLVVDPLVKAVYVLRFHSVESASTGADLLADLETLPPRRRTAGIACASLVALLLLFAPLAIGQEPAPPAPPAIGQAELDASIDEVMNRPEFTWRMPREFAPEEAGEKGFFARFLDSVSEWLRDAAAAVGRFFEWLFSHRGKDAPRKEWNHRGFDPALLRGLAILLLVALAGVLAWFVVKMLRARRTPPPGVEQAEVVGVSVDLEDENLVATLLAEDEWIALAHTLAAAGEFRKAMRAWFLAGVAFLARIDLLVVLKSKSNLDYRRELLRRARRCPAVVPVFGENIAIFERAWYGLHTATAEDLGQLEQNLERMRHGVET